MQNLTVDNLCDACERKPDKGCAEPCETWYKVLNGENVDLNAILGASTEE